MRRCVLAEPAGPEEGSLPALHLCLTCPQPGTGTQPSPVTTLTQETHSHPWSPPCHTLLQNAFRSLPGPLSALPRPGTPPSPAKPQDSPSSSKITVPQGFHEKAITLTNENFTPTFPFCCISLHRFPSCANCNISVEHEHALRSESFTAAFRGLPMR